MSNFGFANNIVLDNNKSINWRSSTGNIFPIINTDTNGNLFINSIGGANGDIYFNHVSGGNTDSIYVSGPMNLNNLNVSGTSTTLGNIIFETDTQGSSIGFDNYNNGAIYNNSTYTSFEGYNDFCELIGKSVNIKSSNTSSGSINFDFGSNLTKMTILSNGNIGIGTTSPSYLLDVAGTFNVSGTSTFNTISSAIITGASISSTSISSANLNALTITSGTLLANTLISSANLSSLIITGTSISSISISSANLNALTITSGTLNVSGNSTFGGHLIPSTNITYDLGSSTNRWRDLYLSGNTINLGGTLISSTSGNAINCISTWNSRVSPNERQWLSVVWAPSLGIFVAVGNSNGDGSAPRVMTSSNGINWTSNSGLINDDYTCVCWSPELSLFVATESSGIISYSSNGISWSTASGTGVNSWTSVCWSAELSLFVAVGSSGSGNRVITSSNGTAWTSRTSAADNSWNSVCWSPELNLFVAVSTTGTTDRVMTSSNGTNWTIQTTPNVSLYSICWSSDFGIFAAVSDDNNGQVVTSLNGTTWTGISVNGSDSNDNWTGITYSSELGIFVGIDNSSGVSTTLYSLDGVNWYRTDGPSGSFYGICWSPELSIFVQVGINGVNSIYTSNSGKDIILNGNVGIGTTQASTTLDIAGTLKVSGNSTLGNIFVSGNSTFGNNIFVNGNSTFGGHLIPSSNVTYDLGSSINKWQDLNCQKINITIPGSGTGLTGFNVFQPSMGDSGYFISDIIGKASGSNYNSMQRFYQHVGDSDVNNRIEYAWWGIVNPIFKMTAENKIGINISGNPSTTLDVGGTLSVSGNSTFGGHLIPSSNITYDLGSSTNRWRDIYLSGNTINLGGVAISSNSAGGTIAFGSTVLNTTTGGNSNFENISSSNLSSLTITGGTLLVDTLISSANLSSLMITTGTLLSTLVRSTTITSANIHLSNILSVASRISAGSCLASIGTLVSSTLISSANLSSLVITGTSISSTLISSANLSALTISTGTLLVNSIFLNTTLLSSPSSGVLSLGNSGRLISKRISDPYGTGASIFFSNNIWGYGDREIQMEANYIKIISPEVNNVLVELNGDFLCGGVATFVNNISCAGRISSANLSVSGNSTFGSIYIQTAGSLQAGINTTNSNFAFRSSVFTPNVFSIHSGWSDQISGLFFGNSQNINDNKSTAIISDPAGLSAGLGSLKLCVATSGNVSIADAKLIVKNTGDVYITGGNLGIGTATPVVKLDVNGTISHNVAANFGTISLVPAVSPNSGYIEWKKSNGATRNAYMGFSSTGVDLTLESGIFTVNGTVKASSFYSVSSSLSVSAGVDTVIQTLTGNMTGTVYVNASNCSAVGQFVGYSGVSSYRMVTSNNISNGGTISVTIVNGESTIKVNYSAGGTVYYTILFART